jgi:uncharacterized protein YdhG (YjbR/CyaY superfamily)
MTKASNHDAYIAAAPEDLRPLLDNLRAQLSRTLADAEEVITYNMPGFRIGKTIVAGYAAFTKQCGIYTCLPVQSILLLATLPRLGLRRPRLA